MIKKIGSNKYGVVEYAISSVEDIADLPLGVAIGSTAVLIDKDGIRTFALGEGEWVEYIDAERYDKNKLAQDLLFCGFGNDGEKHDDLDDRLMVEFDEINERVNVGNYLGYNGCEVKADYSLEGLQRGMMLEGRTLQNISEYNQTFTLGYDVTTDYSTFIPNVRTPKMKPSTIYTCCVFSEVTYHWRGSCFDNGVEIGINNLNHMETNKLYTFISKKQPTQNDIGFRMYLKGNEIPVPIGTTFKLLILEGDHTNTPISEIPYFEGIQSVGQTEGNVISGKSCGKNLFDVNSLIEGKKIDDNGNVANGTNTVLTGFIRLKENTMYSYTVQNPSEVPDAYNGTRCSFYDINKNLIRQKWIVYDNIFNSDNSCYLRMHFVIDGGTAHTTLDNVKTAMLEEASTPTSYEPYQETTYSYILDEPLRSLPNGVCDTIDLETGVLTRRVGEYTLKGTEPLSIASEVTGSVTCLYSSYNNLNINRVDTTNNIMCDKLPVYNYGRYEDIEGIMSSHSCIIVSFKNVSDYYGAVERLKSNPITFYYELAEPTIHQLAQNRIYSFKDTTHVTSDNLIAPRITTNILTNSNALISHLKGENLALANEVSTLSLRNRETQETNETQDHIIDASLCAVDELYMMYETTQEVEAMSTDEEGSRMVDMYVAMVQRGLKTIDQVPVRYRERVREILAQLED